MPYIHIDLRDIFDEMSDEDLTNSALEAIKAQKAGV